MGNDEDPGVGPVFIKKLDSTFHEVIFISYYEASPLSSGRSKLFLVSRKSIVLPYLLKRFFCDHPHVGIFIH